jgi:NADPH-dependent 2,4-dienoyl-CoA reductase/sulfur reductase-like enzyme
VTHDQHRLVIVADAYPNYSICGLPFYISGETPAWQDLAHRSRRDLEAAGLRLWLDHVAAEIDADRRTLSVRDPDGGQRVVGDDQLIIGTGAVPAKPPIDGLDLPGVHLLHTMGHMFAVHEHITRPLTRHAVIVGAGYIGLELADAFAHRGLDVTVVEMVVSGERDACERGCSRPGSAGGA